MISQIIATQASAQIASIQRTDGSQAVLQNQNASILPLNTSSLSKSVSKSETHHKSLKVEETATPSDKHTPKQSKPATKEAASTDIIDVAVEYFMLDDDDMYALMTDELN